MPNQTIDTVATSAQTTAIATSSSTAAPTDAGSRRSVVAHALALPVASPLGPPHATFPARPSGPAVAGKHRARARPGQRHAVVRVRTVVSVSPSPPRESTARLLARSLPGPDDHRVLWTDSSRRAAFALWAGSVAGAALLAARPGDPGPIPGGWLLVLTVLGFLAVRGSRLAWTVLTALNAGLLATVVVLLPWPLEPQVAAFYGLVALGLTGLVVAGAAPRVRVRAPAPHGSDA